MSAELAFALGVAVGALLAFIILVVAQAAKKEETAVVLAAGDKQRDETEKAVTAIDQKRDQAHATIDQLTADEIDLVLNGSSTLDDVMRKRAAATPAGGKPVG